MRPFFGFSTQATKPTVGFILGGPCCGKGTQSALIERHLGYKHLSAGQLLREERNNPSSEHGELIESTIIKGQIVPSFITVSLLQRGIKKNSISYTKFLIDGFPRNMQNLEKWNSEMGSKVKTDWVIFLTCSEQTMENRLLKRSTNSKRSDDSVEVIQKRFRTFKEQTLPVIEWFRKNGKVVQVNAQQSVDAIFTQIKSKLQQVHS